MTDSLQERIAIHIQKKKLKMGRTASRNKKHPEVQKEIAARKARIAANKAARDAMSAELLRKQQEDKARIEKEAKEKYEKDNAVQIKLAADVKIIEDHMKRSPLVWGMVFLDHYFKRNTPPFHMEIDKAAAENMNVAIQAPRGSAKSTVLSLMHPSHGIFYKKYHFIIIVQNTFKKSAATLDNIKQEFRDNPKITQFGIKFMKDAEGDTIFQHPDGFKTRVLCKGADQLGTIRGERFGPDRPDLIIIDDLEDDEMVKNPERRQDLRTQFNEVLKYAGEIDTTRTIVVGTILHDDSLLANLLRKKNYKNFKKMFYQARQEYVNDTFGSLWKEKWSMDLLAELEAEDPVSFAKELQGDPSTGSLETIKREDFRYWAEIAGEIILYNADRSVKNKWKMTDCRAGIGIDLAWEEGKSNDWSVFFPGLITPGNDLLLDSYIYKKGMRPDEWEQNAFYLNEKYEKLTGKRVCFGFEKSKLEKVMKWFLQESMRRNNKWLWTKPISWGTKDKVERFYFRMANRYASHGVFHKNGLGIYENQIIRLKSTAHDDHADAAGMLPELLAFAPSVAKVQTVETTFDWWRQKTIEAKKPRKEGYVYGWKHTSRQGVPAFEAAPMTM